MHREKAIYPTEPTPYPLVTPLLWLAYSAILPALNARLWPTLLVIRLLRKMRHGLVSPG